MTTDRKNEIVTGQRHVWRPWHTFVVCRFCGARRPAWNGDALDCRRVVRRQAAPAAEELAVSDMQWEGCPNGD